jgi:flagellin
MTIWFSTNIPEMRAISTFNRVSTDISDIQQRITSGQRINSGKDDPGGLVLREGLRMEIKSIQALQAGMTQATNLTDIAAGGMMQLLEILQGADPNDPSSGGLIRDMGGDLEPADKQALAKKVLALYDATEASTKYNSVGQLAGSAAAGGTYQLGGGQNLIVTIANLASTGSGAAVALATAINDTTFSSAAVVGAAETLVTAISKALGVLGGSQKIIATNQRLLDSRLTNVTAAEGRISNADIAIESSRMARAELLAQNAMSSILYTRKYAAFAVSSLFG